MEPMTGQGANSALVDAAVLSLELQRPATSTAEALRRYERRRRPAVLRVQQAGDRLARLASPQGPVRSTLRDAAIRALSHPSVLTRQVRLAQQEDPSTLLDQLLAVEPLDRPGRRGPT
jgi:2-polyprenyl-6-methoxyphenol hydroxylase-like FAD-dependent oxidoreductase